MKKRTLVLLGMILPSIAACSVLSSGFSPAHGPTPVPAPSPTPLPAAEVHVFVSPPESTAADADLALVLLDEVTGLAFNTRTLPLERLEDGRWYVRLTPPAGALVHYRYQRRQPEAALEVSGDGQLIYERVLFVNGPAEVNDIIAAWSDAPYFGLTGRIIGRVFDAETGQGLPEMLVSASGRRVFTEGDGGFRIDGLLPGLQHITAWSPDGSYRMTQQGAVVAPGSTTPAEMGMQPAKPIQVTFQVTLPADTFPGDAVRVAGNTSQLGNRFSELESDSRMAAANMPTLIMIDPTHYLGVANLYAGTDLRYKYTMGDGLWNAERNARGFFTTRQVILPEEDVVLQDSVATWHSDAFGSLEFRVQVPEYTPQTNTIHIQFNPFSWFEPVPMWRTGEREWLYILHSPLNFSGPLAYRYCRDQACGFADDVDTSGPEAAGHSAAPTRAQQSIQDDVKGWSWYTEDIPEVDVVTDGITARPGFELGMELQPQYHPAWNADIQHSLDFVATTGANAITLSPSWTLEETRSVPAIHFDPARSPFRSELLAVGREAHSLGLQVNLHPRLQPRRSSPDFWWHEARKDRDWWEVWFEEYRSFMLTQAQIAADLQAEKLILGEPILQPMQPGGQLHDGSPSGVPGDAGQRWRAIIEEMRTLYSGDLAFELELGADLQPLPEFIDLIDELHIHWHAPLSSQPSPSFGDLRSAAEAWLDETLLPQTSAFGLPIVLSVEYPSVAGGVAACPPAPDGSCRSTASFAMGAVVDADLDLDFEGQAKAVSAVLLEAAERGQVVGFYARGYNAALAMQDKSASVNGKPAMRVLSALFPEITGASP